MSTQKETVEFILEKLGEPERPASRRGANASRGGFSVRAMFGEYALYADPHSAKGYGAASAKVVGLVCNDQLYVKILPASAELEGICDKDEAYPGSKKFYVVEEHQLSEIKNLSDILLDIARSVPEKKVKKKKAKK